MRKRAFTLLATILPLVAGALTLGGHSWAVSHARRWTGRADLNFVGCNHCHGVELTRLPWAQPHPRHRSPAGMVASEDGKLLYVALDDVDEVVEVEVAKRKVSRTVQVPGGPFGLALGARGQKLYAACRTGDRVAVLDTASLKETESIGVGEAPVGIAFCETKAGARLVVANSLSDNVSVLALEPLRELSRPQAGREPYAVSVAADGSRAFVANRLGVPESYLSVAKSELTVIDPARGRLVTRHALESAHLAEGVATVPGRGWTLTGVVKVRNLVPITQVANGWVMSSGLAVAGAAAGIVQLPLDEAQDFYADPSGIVVDAAGARAYVASGGSDTVSILDLARMAAWLAKADETTRQHAIEDLALSGEYVEGRIGTGRNPRHLALSPDGKTLFVAERLEDSVLVVDTTALKPVGRIRLGDGGAADPIRRGERVFTNARYTFLREFSCRSCHPDGHMDGLSYDFDGDGIGDNLLDNRSLQGVAGTAPFKWVGKNPSLEVQCGPRFARVLMRTDPIPPQDLRDLTTYLNSLPPPRWERKREQPLTPAQDRGRALFFATTTSEGKPIPRARQCQTCHRPPLFTNRLLSSIGTRSATDTTDLFDTPQLLGVAHTGPYLHDGRAKALEELWTIYQTNDLHGVSSYMNKRQLNDLVEFLKTL
jgi:YVTN family beta-propeller protein